MVYWPLDPMKNVRRSIRILVEYKAPLSMTTTKTGRKAAKPSGMKQRVR